MRHTDKKLQILRILIECITIAPDPETSKPEIGLECDLAGILSLSQTNKKAAFISEDDISQLTHYYSYIFR